jgi:hypothetical protein
MEGGQSGTAVFWEVDHEDANLPIVNRLQDSVDLAVRSVQQAVHRFPMSMTSTPTKKTCGPIVVKPFPRQSTARRSDLFR